MVHDPLELVCEVHEGVINRHDRFLWDSVLVASICIRESKRQVLSLEFGAIAIFLCNFGLQGSSLNALDLMFSLKPDLRLCSRANALTQRGPWDTFVTGLLRQIARPTYPGKNERNRSTNDPLN